MRHPDYSLFHGQFVIQNGNVDAPVDWVREQCHDWALAVAPSCRVHKLEDSDGSHCGWLLGNPVSADGLYETGSGKSNDILIGKYIESDVDIERFIYRHGGRFVAIVLTPSSSRMYLDPLGSMAVVFHRKKSIAASTTGLLVADEASWPNENRTETEFPWNRAGPGGFFPCDLTYDASIGKVLPNHYLDLRTREVVRHWPVPGIGPDTLGDPAVHVATIHATVSRQIGAFVKGTGGALSGLTSGRNSRTILACSRDHLEEMEWVTLASSNTASQIDVETAKTLTKRFRLNHYIHEVEPLSNDDRDEYLARVGYIRNSAWSRKDLVTLRRHFPMDTTWVWGFGGEIGRGYFWRSRPESLERDEPVEKLLEYLQLPVRDDFCAALEKWYAGVAFVDRRIRLDLLFLEQLIGCSGSPHLYGIAPFERCMMPWCHRDVMSSMLSMPYDYRAAQGYVEDVINLAWPELLRVPFKSWAGMRGARQQVKRKLRESLHTLTSVFQKTNED